MNEYELARRVLARIESREHFTTHTLARDREGKGVTPTSPAATCWCLFGAIFCELSVDDINQLDEQDELVYKRLQRHISVASQFQIWELAHRLNDHRGHHAVKQVLEVVVRGESHSGPAH